MLWSLEPNLALSISAQKSIGNVRLPLIFLQAAANPLQNGFITEVFMVSVLSKAAWYSSGLNIGITDLLYRLQLRSVYNGGLWYTHASAKTQHALKEGKRNKSHRETAITSTDFYVQVGPRLHMKVESLLPCSCRAGSGKGRLETPNNPALGAQIWPPMPFPKGECCNVRLFLELPRKPSSPSGQHIFEAFC